jgi:tRNA-dihydrouridine synthase
VIESWVSHLLEEEPATIAVHGRTLEQMYRGEADWSAIGRAARVTRGTRTLLLGNGDVQALDDMVRRVQESGVHGVLVGRGALGSPWFFRGKEAARTACRQGLAPAADPDMTLAERFEVMLGHARQFEGLFGGERFPRLRKHLGWYCTGFRHAAAMRGRMVRASSSRDVERLIAEYLAGVSGQVDAPVQCA